jgi:hypothetical protein
MLTTNTALELQIHRGDGTLALLDDVEFGRAWRDLHDACPWAHLLSRRSVRPHTVTDL